MWTPPPETRDHSFCNPGHSVKRVRVSGLSVQHFDACRRPAWRCAGRVHIAYSRSEALQLPLVSPAPSRRLFAHAPLRLLPRPRRRRLARMPGRRRSLGGTGLLNYAAFRRFRGVLRCRSERGLAARSRATRAGMRRPGPACRAKSAERGVPRIRIVPMAGNRAQKAAASRFRLIAAAAGRDWILMLPKPRRAARPSPCQVLASPWNPSDRQRWRRQGRRSSSLHRRRRLRARSSAGWSALTATVFRFRLPGTQSPPGGHPEPGRRAQGCGCPEPAAQATRQRTVPAWPTACASACRGSPPFPQQHHVPRITEQRIFNSHDMDPVRASPRRPAASIDAPH